jgi:cytochrome c biogenesis protein CcmG/thiol:disulfide interchange protein DsbE
VSARFLAVLVGVLAVIGLLAYGLLSKSNAELAVGDAVPSDTLARLDGHGSGSLADYRGRWVLVNVWASWCPPCRDESPALESFYRRYSGPHFTVLGIDSRDLSTDGLRFTQQYGMTYPELRDGDGSYAKDLGTTGQPESFLVNPEGRLAVHWPGPLTQGMLQRDVLPLIAKPSAQ